MRSEIVSLFALLSIRVGDNQTWELQNRRGLRGVLRPTRKKGLRALSGTWAMTPTSPKTLSIQDSSFESSN
jgi:hypothetical protein